MGVLEIARRLGRSASTVSRGLRRNLLTHDRKTYDGDLAHARARDVPVACAVGAWTNLWPYEKRVCSPHR